MTISDDDRRFARNLSYGVLGGEALDELDSVETKLEKDGVLFLLKCRDFGHANGILVSWQDIITLANAVCPAAWEKTPQGRAFPRVGCRLCHELCTMELTPDEAGRYVQQGMSAGLVNRLYIQQVSQQLSR